MENATKEENKAIAERIKEFRARYNLNQVQLAEIAGVTRSAVCRWEKGDVNNLKSNAIASIVNRYPEINPVWFLGIDVPILRPTKEQEELVGKITGKLEKMDESQLKKTLKFIEDYIL